MGLDLQYPPFDFSTRLGVVFIVESAILSALAVLSCLAYILYCAVRMRRGASCNWTTETHVHYYFLNLLISDLVQAVGGILSVKWVVDGGVSRGALCTAQGVLKQMGDVGVALTSLAIAIHTFCVLVLHLRSPPKTPLIVISLIWLFILLDPTISLATHKGKDYFGDTEYWCWITEDYSIQRIALEYFWLWLTAFVNIIIYIILALVVKGVIVLENRRLHFRRKDSEVVLHRLLQTGSESGAIAMQLLFYPLVYIVTVLPVAVVRWMAFCGHDVPFSATCFSSILFSSSGLFNVLLYKMTRPKLLPSRANMTMKSAPPIETHHSSRQFRGTRRPSDDSTKDFELADWNLDSNERPEKAMMVYIDRTTEAKVDHILPQPNPLLSREYGPHCV